MVPLQAKSVQQLQENPLCGGDFLTGGTVAGGKLHRQATPLPRSALPRRPVLAKQLHGAGVGSLLQKCQIFQLSFHIHSLCLLGELRLQLPPLFQSQLILPLCLVQSHQCHLRAKDKAAFRIASQQRFMQENRLVLKALTPQGLPIKV